MMCNRIARGHVSDASHRKRRHTRHSRVQSLTITVNCVTCRGEECRFAHGHASPTLSPFVADADRAPPAGRDRRYKRRSDFQDGGAIIEY
ncbi:hypothetical protein EVAR_101063_1 [Eumeta japonica]|uniref:Uncharacterized protein n=1 Tax=Eumeta variegata TaxID=151549 RepID=A0A4C2ACK7_EUMVA|nr:hypothetical protein EVAR_101063_1 [Eumeta japonica]